MFRVIDDKIYFKDMKVASFDPFLRETVKMDIREALDNYISQEEFDRVKDENETLIDTIARLEGELMENSPSEIVGAKWHA